MNRTTTALNVLYLHPLQQGLKLNLRLCKNQCQMRSLLTSITTRIETAVRNDYSNGQHRFFTYIHYNKDWNISYSVVNSFLLTVLYLHPLQQGLKLDYHYLELLTLLRSLLTSITTRIETRTRKIRSAKNQVLYLHPLQQGLKHLITNKQRPKFCVLYLHPLQQGLKHF